MAKKTNTFTHLARAMESLPWIVRLIITILYGLYGNLIGIILAVILIISGGLLVLWIVDIIMVALNKRILWID